MNKLLILLCAGFLFSCAPAPEEKQQVEAPNINDIATDYVKLILEVGLYDSDVVDAYYGPQAWKDALGEKQDIFPLDTLSMRASSLKAQISAIDTSAFSDEEHARHHMLSKQLTAISTKINMLGGIKYSFDEEAKLLYDAQPPTYELSYFDDLLSELDAKVPGQGKLSERFNAYQSKFQIPSDKLSDVFQTAINESRKRTLANMPLPENENFVLEYVKDKAWSGYNYYQGNAQSLIQINTDFPIYIDRVVDLAAHEGYPGHHVFNLLLEQNLAKDKGWVEFSIYPLFSPQSLIAEGSANYGIDVAFPGAGRIQYEKDVLFPIAGINPEEADLYYEILAIRGRLNYARNEVARAYLNGDITREEGAELLSKYLLMSPERALQSTRFIDKYRSYVINYNLGKDLVGQYMQAKGATSTNPELRWEVFTKLLSSPHTASSMANAK
ncbi:MAG: hypothetical protein WA981_07965 [Glaciecola sp.]